jgi:hypothetical protein
MLSCGISPKPEISLEESTMMVLDVSETYLAISLIILVFPVPLITLKKSNQIPGGPRNKIDFFLSKMSEITLAIPTIGFPTLKVTPMISSSMLLMIEILCNYLSIPVLLFGKIFKFLVMYSRFSLVTRSSDY